MYSDLIFVTIYFILIVTRGVVKRGSGGVLGEGGTFVGTSRVIIGKLRSGQISGSGSCWKITFVIIIFRKN